MVGTKPLLVCTCTTFDTTSVANKDHVSTDGANDRTMQAIPRGSTFGTGTDTARCALHLACRNRDSSIKDEILTTEEAALFRWVIFKVVVNTAVQLVDLG